MTSLRGGVATDTGRIRSNNEDTSLADDDLFAVADGMGGHRAGEVASNVAVAALRANFVDRTLQGLVGAVQRANERIYEQASEDPDLRGMGTTLVAVAIVDPEPAADEEDGAEPKPGEVEELGWVNVGDSRVYILRDGELQQLSADHSLVEEMVRDGQLSADEAATHPRRHIVTRALGIDPHVRVDAATVVPYAGDRFLLCSDGLYEEVDDGRIAATLRRLADPTDAARELVRLAIEAGGRDNVTVIVVDVVDDGGRAKAASTALADDPVLGHTTAVSVVAPADSGGTKKANGKAKPTDDPPKPGRKRRATLRLAVFAIALLAIVGAAIGAIGVYARHTYYVGFAGTKVAIYRGRPGGFLWFDPTLEQTTTIARADVPAARVDDIASGVQEGTKGAALAYVHNLQSQIDEQQSSTSTSTTTSTPAGSTSTST